MESEGGARHPQMCVVETKSPSSEGNRSGVCREYLDYSEQTVKRTFTKEAADTEA